MRTEEESTAQLTVVSAPSVPLSGSADLPQPCPVCSGLLELSWRLTAKPIGSFSLAGAQMKVSALVRAQVLCAGCGLAAVGSLPGAVMAADGRSFTGGHFVADRAVSGQSEEEVRLHEHD